MRTYSEIAQIAAERLIANYKEKGFEWMTGFIHGINARKGSKDYTDYILKIRNLSEEGLSPKEIVDLLKLNDQKVLGQNIINDWNYPDSIDTEKLSIFLDSLSKEYGISREEALFFMLVNFMNALIIRMVDGHPR
jgi:hypothetical protein